jgi:hypothetical protein
MHNLDTRIIIAGETDTIRNFAHRGKITSHHAKSFARNRSTGEAFFADVGIRGGTPIGVEITRKAYAQLEGLLA